MSIRNCFHHSLQRRLFGLPIAILLTAAACGGDGGSSPAPAPSVPPTPAPAPNRAPTAVGTIPEQKLTPGSDPTTLNIAPNFSDPDGDALSYRAASDNTAVVQASVSGSVLTLTPAAAGTATVTVTASDPGGLSATHTFQVGVQPAETPNRTPTAVGSMPDQLLTEGDDPTTLNLASYFSDPDGDVLSYGAASSDAAVVSASVSGSVLTLTPAAAGTATVTVTASDPGGLTATQPVSVTVQSTVEQTYASGDRIPTWPAGFWVPDFNRDARYTYSVYVSIQLGPRGYIEEEGIRYTCLRNDLCGMVDGRVVAGPIVASEAEHSGNNHQPIATIRAIPEQSLIIGRTATVAASRYFVEPDGDVLRYSADTSGSGVARASVSAETVTITAVGGGTATITVTATDPGGLAAMQGVEVTVEANRPPEAVGEIPDQMLDVGQPPPTIDVADYFRDPGDSLTYTATSSDREVATVSLSGSMLTVTAVGEGRSTITVTARDLQGLETQQGFVTTVAANPDRTALVAIYEATGGDNWDQNRNWLTDAPLGDWHGVGVTRTGRVFSLSLPNNNLKGRLPPEIGDLSRLESLDLHRNWRPGPSSIGLTGRIPPEIGQLSNLSDLNLSSNELIGPVPTELADLTNLVRLDLGWNDLTGRIPIELTELPALAELNLAQSNLTGPIPGELGAMAALTKLDLHGNGLSGGIPPELGNLTLTTLSLGFNNLTGPIPPELGDITTLLSLFLWNNRLTGPIPEELGNLGRLLNLALSDNLLTGPVPESFLQLRLFSFHAADNVSVCIPDTPQFATWVNSLTQYDEPPLCTRP